MKFYTLIKNFYFTFILTSFILAAAPDWDCDGDGIFDDINAYESSGSVTAAVFIDGSNAGSEGDMLGAFVGDGAVIDYEFNTTDVCIVLPTTKVASRYKLHYDRK